MDKKNAFILWFDQLGIEDVPLVGGKNASLGEMYRELTSKGVRVPNGFAITAYSYFYLLEKEQAKEKIKEILKDLDTHNIKNLQERGEKVRKLIKNIELPKELAEQITREYQNLCKAYKQQNVDVAVRSSATAEDLPDASFAGQQETYLNIRGEKQLLDACKKCFASLFTNRAISYREDKGFDHFSIGLSIAVQKMVRSDKACSGVMFSIDTESGFKDVVFVTGSWGLGENIVQGAVNPDEFYVFKPTMKKGFKPILSKKVGSKEKKMVYSTDRNKPTKNINTTEGERKKFCLTDDEILTLAKWGCIIEDHYSAKAGHFKPMDMEWAKDGVDKHLYIVQARPETVHSQKDVDVLKKYVLKEKGQVLVEGNAVGEMIGQGDANVIAEVKQIGNFKKGQVLVTDMTDPDWEPIMKIASAIVTNRGGRTCFTGDTVLLTNQGFRTFKEVFNDYDGLYVPSLNKETLKIEWKPVIASMKRESEVIEVGVSQTGRMKGNTLNLTPDHKMLTFKDRELVGRQVSTLLEGEQMLLLAQKIPQLNTSTDKEHKLAYLLGALITDGSIYLSSTHGEVQFIQKPTEEKEEFIYQVNQCMEKLFNKSFKAVKKKTSSGLIRGELVEGNATAYRCYSKQIATQLNQEKQLIVQTLLQADTTLVLNYLAGVIDGDGSYSHQSSRINIYCSSRLLLESIVVSCLRLGVVPQITTNRTIWNVQIVERIDEILAYTKRVKGKDNRTVNGVRFFSAKQVMGDIVDKVNYKGRIKTYVVNNLMIDADKIIKNVLPMCSEREKYELNKLIESDTRMQRVSFVEEKGIKEVYNITVADNHNYIVFTSRLTPVLVNNCHAAIVSRELGIPCIVGTLKATTKIKSGQKVTVDCSQGTNGYVYEGLLKFEVEETDLKGLKRPKTKIMMNIGNPEQAFDLSFIPNDGVGLAREEFIINSYIRVHPLALLKYDKLKDNKAKKIISELTYGYKKKGDYFVDKLAQGIAMLGAAFYPHDVIVRLSDFKSNEYANLIGGKQFEPEEDNPMIGWRGASRYYDKNYKEAFNLECKALKRVRDEMGLTNIVVMIPFCRTADEGKKVVETMEEFGLKQGENELRIVCMCEIPSNVIMAEEFLDIFDGFSIGSNDLTQLTLGLDRDSELVSHIYDERNDAVKKLVKQVIEIANRKGKYIGICGQAPSDFPEFAEFLVKCGIKSMSLNPDTVMKTTLLVKKKEEELGIK
ncbi:phosphoenolpyruvate synthase [Candidatus Woesearchaeota archaeon]|nr:phosphoenolpyruvate synthase [Candidatus Woesearchaeota archaeon]